MSTQSASVDASVSPVDATSHANSVGVTCSMIQSMSYIEGSLVITQGQPSSPPPSFTQSGDTWTITLNCGRKSSSSVATSFNNQTGGSVHEYAPSGGGGTPGNLNFYFGVRITMLVNNTQIPVDVYFAQGSYGTTNNWWIGGNTVVNKGDALLLVINNNLITQILALSGSHDSVTMTPLS
jgi:hypothetical protein